jgi:hypothetical protein
LPSGPGIVFAELLFAQKGYEQTTANDILDKLEELHRPANALMHQMSIVEAVRSIAPLLGGLCFPVIPCVCLLLSVYHIRNYVKRFVPSCVCVLFYVTMFSKILLSYLLSKIISSTE